MRFRRICFDLDDTLIPNSFLYDTAKWRCGSLIAKALGIRCPRASHLLTLMEETDRAAFQKFGLSADRFPASMVRAYETAAENAGMPVDPEIARRVRDTAERYKLGPYRPLPGVRPALKQLRAFRCQLHLVTAGDDLLQRVKIVKAGLGSHFDSIDVVPKDKKPALAAIVGDRPELGVMVGDSPGSDIQPAIELGMTAVFVPSNTWSVVHADVDPSKYHTISSVRELPALLQKLSR